MALKMPTSKTKIRYSGGSRGARGMDMDRIPIATEIEQEEPMGLINGREPGSEYEWNMARALWFYGWDEFLYQVGVRGGYEIRGGQVLDFLVPTRPMWTAMPVDGGYWHRNAANEQLKDAELLRALRNMGYQVNNEVLHAKDKDCVTIAASKQFVFKNFGRA